MESKYACAHALLPWRCCRFDPSNLATLNQVTYNDGVPGTLTTAHPELLPDGSLLNFSRSTPNGGFHIYKQVCRNTSTPSLALNRR